MDRYRIDWGELAAIQPTPVEVALHAPALAGAYNDPHNAPLLGHTAPISPAEVVEIYEDDRRRFLFLRDGALVGDGDLRTDGAHAEFSFLIVSRAVQGQGLGTRFATMVHLLGFRELGLAAIFASVVPANVASCRAFEKLGYAVDDSPRANAFRDEPGDVVLAIDAATFGERNRAAMADIRVSMR